jgi:2-hydroxychromene-2-carboxylate isomerase
VSRLKPRLLEFYVSEWMMGVRRRVARLRHGRMAAGLTFVHEVDDPHSVLLAQVVERVADEAGVELKTLVIPTPDTSAVPDLDRQRAWALKDASHLASRYGLEFPAAARRPEPDAVARAQAMAVAPGVSMRALIDISMALLSGHTPPQPASATPETGDVLASNQSTVTRLGHYQGAMIHFEGEWFWGLDRLSYLGDRLGVHDLEGRVLMPAGPKANPVQGNAIEYFYSFRSPYSYLSLDRTLSLAERVGVPLRIRPVLPMVMRGLAVPFSKRRYIILDCKRVATRLGLPFGRIADPVGLGVERALAAVEHAEELGRLPQWMRETAKATWAEGIRLDEDHGLAEVARRAGLDPKTVLDADTGPNAGWRATVEDNRQALLSYGLWGVPSYRVGDLALWGQDRLDVLEAALGARSAVPP